MNLDSMIPTSITSSIILAGICLVIPDLPHAHAVQAGFSPQAWRGAVDSKSSTWSRKELLSQFYNQYRLEGMPRVRVIELLGEPAIAYELYPVSDQRERIDVYRLSAKNEDSLRIEYNTQDKVSSAFVDTRSCKAEAFAGAAPVAEKVLISATLEKVLEKYSREQITSMQISQLEALIGKSDKNWSRKSLVGGQTWMYYNYVWRLSVNGRRVFTAYGHVPLRNWDETGARVHSYAIISMGPDCLPGLPNS
jgi:hypothetical protein